MLCEVQTDKPEHTGISNERALNKVTSMYEGHGRGAELESTKSTAWDLLNSVTEYVDHERRARSNEYRMDAAGLGQGAVIEQRALETAHRLVA